MRNDEWLVEKLSLIWKKFFSDVPKSNQVKIKFGRCARTRLGSIKSVNSRRFIVYGSEARNTPSTTDHPPSTITLTGYFKDERVPEYVIDLTIAHELCHYAHGFSSPLPQLSRYPHQGGIVDKEMMKRGFGEGLLAQKKWLKTEWRQIIGPVRRRRIRRKKYSGINILKFLSSNFK